jgi:hypothetical protein
MEIYQYQVRAIDIHGNVRIINNYDTDVEAKAAITTMKKRSSARYEYIAVPKPTK